MDYSVEAPLEQGIYTVLNRLLEEAGNKAGKPAILWLVTSPIQQSAVRCYEKPWA